jgi:hypothetical protein
MARKFDTLCGILDDYTEFLVKMSFRIGELELDDMELSALLGSMQISHARFTYSVARVEQEGLPPDGSPAYTFSGE